MSTPIQFSHANGFPSRTYNYLFELLGDVHVTYVEKNGYSKLPLKADVNYFADELIASIEKNHTKPVIGIGHSTGGATVIVAAAKRPDLFKKVIAIEPIIFSRRKRYVMWLVNLFNWGDPSGLITKTKNRRANFPSIEFVKESFANNSFFKSFHPTILADYIKHGFVPNPNGEGVTLAYSKELEAAVFQKPLFKIPPGIDKINATIIYGNTSDTFVNWDVNWWKKAYPHVKLIPFEGGHLFPLQAPEKTAALLKSLI